MNSTKRLFGLLFLALLIRLVCLYPQYSGDLKNHLAWGNGLLSSPLGFYSHHFAGFNDPNYPPLTIFLFAASNLLLNLFNTLFSYLNQNLPIFPSFLVPLFKSENMALGFLKLPGIFSDLGIGYLIFKILHQKKNPHAYFLTSLYLFNPAIIYLSSVWGQIEAVTNYFLLLSLYQFIGPKSKSLAMSIIFFCLAALTKQTALWFFPLYLFLWYRELSFGEWSRGFVSGLLIFVISYLPFGLNPFSAAKNYLATLSGSSNVVSDAAWNLWFFIYPQGTADSIRVGLISVRQLSIYCLFLFLFLFLSRLIKHYSLQRFLNYLFLWSLVVFFFQTRVHERHLAPALVFIFLTSGYGLKFFLDYLILTVLHLYNLIYSLKLPFI